MGSYILFFMILLTSIIGTIEIIRTIYEMFFFKKPETHTISVLPLTVNTEDVEYLIRGALLKTDGKLIVVDMGIDELDSNIISRLNDQYHRITIVKQNELCNYIGAVR
ncbi:hypothetical protein RBG61_00860 [Paludicola sp. MB14-C6]|uniref:hypothetical protein n=1 Tax=Paludihabitans sp. MB14-C6 TaxID=3070656 RepID=UPI0027DAFAAE|nr:hypothetical protein [Paludicola sp. MB14-C6]WMJ23238.1 hypothetical protein RBG61_00860 [Paludicola sp. MB14-C6]